MKRAYKIRRSIVAIIVFIGAIITIAYHPNLQQSAISPPETPTTTSSVVATGDAAETLNQIEVKGRAPKTGYARTQFGDGWQTKQGCDTRNIILHRDLTNTVVDDACHIVSGTLNDPYTGVMINFTRGEASSQAVQIDHVVALSNAWQTGAQGLTAEQRSTLANDPLELLAVDGPANQQKSDGDAATWLPPNKAFRCQYVARQIAVKAKYHLWVTNAEKDAMIHVLQVCPGQTLPAL
jgi:hypothetical protein